METSNARLGLFLFVLYTALYSAFVLLNAFKPELMEATPFAGINIAILYGFGLILTAIIFALIYGWLCKEDAPSSDKKEDSQ